FLPHHDAPRRRPPLRPPFDCALDSLGKQGTRTTIKGSSPRCRVPLLDSCLGHAMSHSPHIYFLSTGLAPSTPSALFPNSHARFSSVFQVVPLRGIVMQRQDVLLKRAQVEEGMSCYSFAFPLSLISLFLHILVSSLPILPVQPDRHKEQYSSPDSRANFSHMLHPQYSIDISRSSFLPLAPHSRWLTDLRHVDADAEHPDALRRKDLGVAARR
ncbi:hypothetical protein B0H13DRAFT_2459450, partial [Mycena leptocephala]